MPSAVTAPLSDRPLPPLDLTIEPWPGHRVSVGGTRIFVRTTPPAPPAPPAPTAQPVPTAQPAPTAGAVAEAALYVHGLGGSSMNWTDLAALLAPRLAGEAIDLPGFGRSGPSPDGDYSLAAHARLVISYLESSGRGPVHLIGNSMGGAISIVIAESRPDLVRTLTLISPAVPDLKPVLKYDPRLAVLLLPAVGPRVLNRMSRMPAEDRVRATLELCFADPSRVPAHRFEEAVEEARGRTGMRWASTAMAASLRSIAGTYLLAGDRGMWGRMSRIKARTVVIWGDQDRLVDVRVAPRVATVIPDARLLVLPGIGHVAQMEDPVSTARAIMAMLDAACSEPESLLRPDGVGR